MELTGMRVLEWGVFDSRVVFPKVIRTRIRPVECFEVELFTEDQSGTACLNGKTVPLRRGTLICAKPGHHRCSQLHFRCLYFHLQTEDLELRKQLQALPDCCVLSDLEKPAELFHKLLCLDPERFPQERLLMQSYLLRLIFELLQLSGCGGGHPDGVPLIHRQLMRDTEQYIRSHLDSCLDLETLAAEANLSPSYFHKLFCRYYSMTPGEFVLSCRISAARTMLVEQELPLGQIAERCGFASQSYFNYRFKQAVGQTPMQYRREHLSRLWV